MLRINIVAVACVFISGFAAGAQEASTTEAPMDSAVRDRYEQALQRSPFQEQAFDRVYKSYLSGEGVDAWSERLKSGLDASPARAADLAILGRIYERQFRPKEAIESLEQARAAGTADPELDILLGTLYYQSGRDKQAIELLTASLDNVTDPEKRGRICRILGSLYLRQGKKDEAIAAWRRIVEGNPNDPFAFEELAAIYQENRLWAETIEVLNRLIEASPDDPYRQCRALRSIGDAQLRLSQHEEAIATYEKALDLAAPGSWLFEDLKDRLVAVYQELGDLQGLTEYLQARIAADPAQVEYRDLLAEAYTRMGKADLAEAEYKGILERAPDRLATYEKLASLYESARQTDRLIETYTKMMELQPDEPDYLRRLGEVYLQAGQPDPAKATWQRVAAAPDAGAGAWAQLAEWYEQYEFTDDALAAYEKALAIEPNKDWVFRAAALRHDRGEKDEAVRLWQSVLVEGTSRAPDYAEVASILLSFGLEAEAEPLLKKAAELEPDNPEHQLALARLLSQLERYEETVPYYTRLADLTENDYFQERGERGLIEAYKALGTLEQKQQEWEAAVQANPQAVAPMVRLARLYVQLGNRPGAIELYKKSAELEPDNPNHLRLLAEAYARNRQFEEAVQAYTQLIERDATRASVYHRALVGLYTSVNRFDDAVAAAQKVVELAPNTPDARTELADAYMRVQKRDEALEQFRQAAQFAPDDPEYLRRYAETLWSMQRWGEAQEVYRQVTEVSADDSSRYDAVQRLGEIYRQQGRLEELLAEFQQAVRDTPKKLSVYRELAGLIKLSGDPARALETLEVGYAATEDKEAGLRMLLSEAYDAQDYKKAAGYYEQLLAFSNKASVFELERLGNIYAQMGDMEKARTVWDRIPEENPQDPAAHEKFGELMMQAGFIEESLASTKRALELDPYNYRLRYSYAQSLAASERMDEAIEQLQAILDYGEPAPSPNEKKAKKPAPAQQPLVSFSSTSRRMMMGGRGWYGTFQDFRRQVIGDMVRMAAQIGDAEPVLKRFEEKAARNAGDVEAQLDLLTAYGESSRVEKAEQVVDALVALRPADPAILGLATEVYSRQGKTDKLIAMMEKLAAQDSPNRRQYTIQLVQYYMQAGRKDDAVRLVDKLIAEVPDDQNLRLQTTGLLMQIGRTEEALASLRRAAEDDPANAVMYKFQIAQLAIQQKKFEDARPVLEEIVLLPSPSPAQAPPPMRSMRGGMLYVPQYQGQPGVTNPGFRGNLNNLTGGLIQNLDFRRVQALGLLIQNSPDPAAMQGLLQRLNEAAASYATAENPAEALELAKMLAAYHVSRDELAPALKIVEGLRAAGASDADLDNLALYLNEQLEKFDAVYALYDEIEAQYPARAADCRRGRFVTALVQGDYDRATKYSRELLAQNPSADMVLMQAQFLMNGKQTKVARELLEGFLATGTRHRGVLTQLARLYSQEGNHDKAIELARAAWESGAQALRPMGGWMYGQYVSGQASEPVNLLTEVYAQANRLPELQKEFEQRLAQQPDSLATLEGLVSIYRRNGQRDKALALYRDLVNKRPNRMQARIALAELLMETGDPKEALAVYEQALDRQPGLYRQLNYRIRELYRTMGREKDLAGLEDRVLRTTSNPDEVRQMAMEARSRGDLERALTLCDRMLAMGLDARTVYNEKATVLEEMGRYSEAADAYTRFVEASPGRGGMAGANRQLLRRQVELFDRAGRLDELKAANAKELQDRPDSPKARWMQIVLAEYDKRYDEALALLDALPEPVNGFDWETVEARVAILEAKGDIDGAIAWLEKQSEQPGAMPWDRLAQMWLKKGDTAKAYEMWQKEAERQGQPHSGFQVFQRLVEYRMWDQAADWFRKSKDSIKRDPNYRRQWIDTIARAYGESGALADLVREEILVPGGEYSLEALRILSNYQSNIKPDEAAALYKPLLEKNPDDAGLLREYGQYMLRNERFADALPVYERLIKLDPNDQDALQQYGECMSRLGRGREASTVLVAAVEANPTPERVQWIAGFLSSTGQMRKLQELRQKLVDGAADEEQKDRIIAMMAMYGATAEDAAQVRAALQRIFEREQSGEAFRRYFDFVVGQGAKEEAYALYEQYKEKFFIGPDAVSSRAIVETLKERNDTAAIDELLWRVATHTNPNEGPWRLGEVLGGVEEGNRIAFLERLEARLAQESEPQVSKRVLAELYVEMQRDDKALELLTAHLAEVPGDATAIQQKLGLLDRLKRTDEKMAFLEEARKHVSPQNNPQVLFSLAELYYQAGRPDDAEAVLDPLRRGQLRDNYRDNLGQFYLKIGQAEKAVVELEEARRSRAPGQWTSPDLVVAYLKVGRADDARKAWESTPDRSWLEQLGVRLAESEQYEAARDVLARAVEAGSRQENVYAQWGASCLRVGDVAGFRQVVDKVRENLQPRVQEQLIYQCAEFLARGNADVTPLAEAVKTDPLVQRVIVEAFRRNTQNKPLHDLVDTLLETPDALAPEALVSLAPQVLAQGDAQMAGQMFSRALTHPEIGPVQRAEVAASLIHMGGVEIAVDALEAAINANPALLVHSEYVIPALAKANDPERAERVLAHLPEVCANDVQVAYIRALYDYYAGRKEPAIAALSAIDPKRLSEQQVLRLRGVLYEAGSPLAEKLDQQIQDVLSNSAAASQIVFDDFDRTLQQGDYAHAVQHLGALTSMTAEEIDAARSALADALKAENLDAVLGGAKEYAAANVAAPNMGHLAGFVSQLARRLGRDVSAAALAQEWGLNEAGSTEAAVWDASVETWRIAGPYAVENKQQGMEEPLPREFEAIARGTASCADAAVEWKNTEPVQTLGMVQVDRVLELDVDARDQQCAYTVVDINSPDERPVTFAHGSDDWVRVWVNGLEVHKNLFGRNAVPNQDIIQVKLKPGRNVLLMKIANNRGDWQFSLAPVKNGEGLTFTAPQ